MSSARAWLLYRPPMRDLINFTMLLLPCAHVRGNTPNGFNAAYAYTVTWCSGMTPAQHAGGPGLSPQRVHFEIYQPFTNHVAMRLPASMSARVGSSSAVLELPGVYLRRTGGERSRASTCALRMFPPPFRSHYRRPIFQYAGVRPTACKVPRLRNAERRRSDISKLPVILSVGFFLRARVRVVRAGSPIARDLQTERT